MLIADLGQQYIRCKLGGSAVRQATEFRECNWIHMTATLGEREGGPFGSPHIPANHDAGALDGKSFKRALCPTRAGGEALNTTKHIHGDLTLPRDQPALLDVNLGLGIVC